MEELKGFSLNILINNKEVIKVNYYNGIPLINSRKLIKGHTNIPRRKNKSKRIQKKWIKKYGFLEIPDPQIYFIDGKIIGHPVTIKKLIKEVKN